jgi:hypothetical protein
MLNNRFAVFLGAIIASASAATPSFAARCGGNFRFPVTLQVVGISLHIAEPARGIS